MTLEASTLRDLSNGVIGPNLVLVYLSNQSSEHLQLSPKCNSQSESGLGNHWASSLALSPICESVFHT
jgi:hypothetical protein